MSFLKKALVIGINKYPTNSLAACENDARSIANLLSTNVDGSENFAVALETNVKTKAELRSKVEMLFDGDADAALFYFSGHGLVNKLGGWLVTPDVKRHDEGMAMDDIMKFAIKSTVKSKIIILDCCYAGEIGNEVFSNHSISQISEGMIILAACSKRETAKEVGEHGIFTNLLTNALRGGAADILGNITPGSVYGYIDRALGAWDQRPVFKAHVSRFISLRNTQEQIEVPILRKLTSYFDSPDVIYPLNPTFEFMNADANPENVLIFKHLQKMASVGLVKPCEEGHLYFAAQNSKGCILTSMGQSYWWLVKEGRI